MSLQPLQLDDLTWTGMVDSIRTRIVANSNGLWTMHSPLDPGVTLLELYADLFEQRLYWLDQVPEPLVRSMLALLDDAPITTKAAKTLLTFHYPKDGQPHQISKGTVFYPRDRELPLHFATLEPLTVLPVRHDENAHDPIGLIVNGQDRSADLRAGRLVTLLPADGGRAEFQIIFRMDRQLTTSEFNGHFNLFLDLETPKAVTPEWAAVPNDMQWFNRVTPAGYIRTADEKNDLTSDRCSPTDVPTDSGVTTWRPNEPTAWIHDFISPDWNYRPGPAQVPAVLQWYYSTGDNARKAFTHDQLTDATGGLRRSGLVRIKVPQDWRPMAYLPSGEAAYALWVTCGSCTYSAPPRLRRAIPNTAAAQHAALIDVDWGVIQKSVASWLRLPGQELLLPKDQPEPLEESVRLFFREHDGQWNPWHSTDHFYHHGPQDRVFVVDRPRKRLVFGDGLTGRIPVLNLGDNDPPVKLCYLAGGGSQGNVGQFIWASRATDLQPVNPVPSIGGAETETLAQAQARVGGDLSRIERAVTAEDFEWLATSTPGVAIARAHAAVGYHPGFPCHPVAGAITVFVVPQVPREPAVFETNEAVLAPQTDPGALAEIARRIDTRRLITSEVYVRSAQYRAVRLQVDLQGIYVNEDSLHTEISGLFTQYLDPLIGGDRHEGWPFGGPIHPSSLVNQVQTLIGDGAVVKRVGIALDSDIAFEDCRQVETGPHDLVYLQALSLSVDRTPTTNGGLR